MNKLVRKLHTLNELTGRARGYRSVPAQLLDIIIHKLKLGIHPRDYYDMEFFKGGKSWKEKRRYVCQNGSLFWPFANNPLRYNLLFIDKYVEKAVLTGLGIQTPKLLAAIGDCYEIRSMEDLAGIFDDTESDVVIKPISGMGGTNVLVVKKVDQGYLSGKQMYSPGDLWNHIKKDYARGWIVEARVTGAGHAQAMHPSSLNTFRVCTIRTNDMNWHAAHTVLKVGRSGAVVDNVGTTGILVYLDDKGRSVDAYDFLQAKKVSHHPDTGVALTDVTVEGYEAVVAAGLAASRKLGFMGTIGWDIAYTEQGPLVLEGNLWWGCKAHQLYSGPMITDELAQGLTLHKPFARWNRSNMYPGFIRDIRKRTARYNRRG